MIIIKVRFKYSAGADTVIDVPIIPIHGDWLWWLFQVPHASRIFTPDLEVVFERNLVGELVATLKKNGTQLGTPFRIP